MSTIAEAFDWYQPVARERPATGIQMTPVTTMAHSRAHHMAGGITPANMRSANDAMGAFFSVSDILHTVPVDPAATGSGAGASQDAKNYGMVMAAMSQYAKDLGMAHPSGMITAMAEDAADGVMDGKMAGATVMMGGGMMSGTMMQATAGTTGLATAMTEFMASAMNRSGVTLADVQALVNQLGAAAGQLPGDGGGTTNGLISGMTRMGSVSGATVTAHAIVNGVMGAQLGSTTTDASGSFTVAAPLSRRRGCCRRCALTRRPAEQLGCIRSGVVGRSCASPRT